MLRVLRLSFLLIFFSIAGVLNGQVLPFELHLEPLTIPDLAGIQSFAFGQADGKWLIVGGRQDGLHQRQPFAAFQSSENNNQLWVIDPVTAEYWTTDLSSLEVSIQEQLSSTNMAFFQEGNYLYCVGGYGYSATIGDHVTYDKLTAIEVSSVIEAVITETTVAPGFRQITDPAFQVTGGKLKKIGSIYHLMGGQKFMGRYNPMGPDHGPGFVQEYTNSIRRFTLSDTGVIIHIEHLPAYIDNVNLHRRDYNAEAQILPGGIPGLTMFSGVFRPDINLPFLNSVNIDSSGYNVNNDFQQFLNHYHCPVLPLYGAEDDKMYNIFFGGIAQYYYTDGILTQDDNVPFVRTIACVSRSADGSMIEEKLPVEMPSLLGAGAEFIPNLDLPHFENKVFRFDDLPNDTLLAGYIYGGISSTQANIFFINNGTQSAASQQVFKVYLKKKELTAVENNGYSDAKGLNLLIYPNPSATGLQVEFSLDQSTDLSIEIYDMNGKMVLNKQLKSIPKGQHNIALGTMAGVSKGVYFVYVKSSSEQAMQKWVVDE